ncbi:MAG: dTDP-4-dehydrorhamnose 3,5-epimerase [Candidatus Sericytochromatia bacterium]|nr:dTDP-4-dehydrorhamnose 3,5-epimerase [Candidatus Sericytochromatia bacterium]
MEFQPLPLAGAWLITLTHLGDERGSFARTFCAETFAAHGLNPVVAQCNVSVNARRGTLRGLHFQREPHDEAKLVRCVRGTIWDVIVDLRPESPTFRQWTAVDLDAAAGRQLYVPEGMAHGFQTLCDDVEVLYQMSAPYVPAAASGLRWDDPDLAIPWPVAASILSERDRSWPLLGD